MMGSIFYIQLQHFNLKLQKVDDKYLIFNKKPFSFTYVQGGPTTYVEYFTILPNKTVLWNMFVSTFCRFVSKQPFKKIFRQSDN